MKDSIPWSMSLRKTFLTSFLIDEIMMIFFITETRLRSWGDVPDYMKREPDWFIDLLNFVKVVRYVTWELAIFYLTVQIFTIE